MKKLRKLGLRNAQSVKANDLLSAASSIQSLLEKNQQQSALQTANA
jgi:hypothetical protein